MTEDLEAIDVLSEKFSEAKRPNKEHIAKGEQVLTMYRAEAQKAPDDIDVKGSLAQHLFRMGQMYLNGLDVRHLHGDIDNRHSTEHRKEYLAEAIRNAQLTCSYMVESYNTLPTASAARILAEVFVSEKFYATAIHWFQQAEAASKDINNTDTLAQAKARRIELQAESKTADPLLTAKMNFPKRDTAGLILENQPAVSTPTGQSSSSQDSSQSGGCGRKAALFFIIVYALAHFVR